MIYKKGDFIGQKYEVYDILGEGGFGIVYLVYSNETKSAYALKTFRDEYLEDVTTRERFKKEAQVWIDLERHPYLVRAYFVDEISGRLFIAMEYIASDEQGLNSLSDYLILKPPDLAQSLRWAIQFCHGMEYAYSKGIKAHRDIKPDNIMIGQDKAVKISDFGLAGVIGSSRITSGIKVDIQKDKVGFSCQTIEGTGFGTPTHMPPEQFINAAGCDERSDIYSLGIVLFQMLSGGKLPFLAALPKNNAYEESRRFWIEMYKLHGQAPVPKLMSPLFPIIQRCLEKEPRKRYQSVKELRADLELLLKKQFGEVIKMPELKELEAWEWGNKGFALGTFGKPRDAIACFDMVLKINPLEAKAWNNKGSALNDLGKYHEAITCFDKTLEIDATSASTWLNKGNALHKLNKFKDAVACYDMALKINPLDVKAWNNKGNVLSDLGKHQEAIACYDWALKIDYMYAKAWMNKGIALNDLGKYHEAITCFDKALEINPIYVEVWHNKGVSLDKLGNFQEAILCYDKYLEINPTDIDVWLNKGLALENLGNFEESIVCYDKALEINPKEAMGWHNKWLLLSKLDKPHAAWESLENFIKYAPPEYTEYVSEIKNKIIERIEERLRKKENGGR